MITTIKHGNKLFESQIDVFYAYGKETKDETSGTDFLAAAHHYRGAIFSSPGLRAGSCVKFRLTRAWYDGELCLQRKGATIRHEFEEKTMFCMHPAEWAVAVCAQMAAVGREEGRGSHEGRISRHEGELVISGQVLYRA